jgi:hypothetical protein
VTGVVEAHHERSGTPRAPPCTAIRNAGRAGPQAAGPHERELPRAARTDDEREPAPPAVGRRAEGGGPVVVSSGAFHGRGTSGHPNEACKGSLSLGRDLPAFPGVV